MTYDAALGNFTSYQRKTTEYLSLLNSTQVKMSFPVHNIKILMFLIDHNGDSIYSFHSIHHMYTGCSPNVDLMILVDASESMIVNDPYGKPLYNWYRVSKIKKLRSISFLKR